MVKLVSEARADYRVGVDTRLCPTCGLVKPTAEYFFRDKARTKPQFQCKACTNAYKRDWYAGNSDHHKEVSEQAKRRRIGQNIRAIQEYLKQHPCVDCGEPDLVVLDFDHVRGEKAGNISRLLRDRPWSVVVAELEKCDVRCANCHRRRTASDRAWYTTYL